MGKHWIIDVLADLQTFAAMNDLTTIAAKIEETLAVAREEFGVTPERADQALCGETGELGSVLSGLRTRGRA